MRVMCFTASEEDTVDGYGHLPYFYCPFTTKSITNFG